MQTQQQHRNEAVRQMIQSQLLLALLLLVSFCPVRVCVCDSNSANISFHSANISSVICP